MGKKKKGKRSTTKSYIGKIIPLILGILLTLFSIIFISGLLSGNPKKPKGISGFDVFYDCGIKPKIFLVLLPIHNSNDIRVVVHIENWSDIHATINSYTVFFPGITYNHKYLLIAEKFPEKPTLSPDEMEGLSRKSTRRNFTSDMETIWDQAFYQTIIKFNPQKINDFCGGIEFIWVNGLERFSYSEAGIILPFQTAKPVGFQLNSVKKYKLQVFAPFRYNLRSSGPQPERFQILGEYAYYQFAINVTKTDFYINFNNEKLSRQKNYLIIIFSTLLGVGLALIVTQIISILRLNKE